jgi:hypothetical protein
MSASRLRIAAAAFSLAGWVTLLPVGVAHADCTSPGHYGAGSDSGSDSGGESGGNGGGGAKPTPIVMPSGQKPPPATPSSGSDSTSTSKPIVPIGSASAAMTRSTSATPTPIVTPHG